MFSEIERLSSCATALSSEKTKSLVGSKLLTPSRSKRTSTPFSLSCRTYFWHSTRLREKREMLLTRIRSVFPPMASSIIAMNCGRFLALVPLMPWSA